MNMSTADIYKHQPLELQPQPHRYHKMIIWGQHPIKLRLNSPTLMVLKIALSCLSITASLNHLNPMTAYSQPAHQSAAKYYIYDNHSAAKLWPTLESTRYPTATVRIGITIKILSLAQQQPQVSQIMSTTSQPSLGPTQNQSTPPLTTMIHKTLRASLNRPNHFVFNSYHIETIPLSWNPADQQYKVRLSLSQNLSSHKAIAHHIGYLDLTGRLEAQHLGRITQAQLNHHHTAIYLLIGTATKIFHSQSYSGATVEVHAGFPDNVPNAQHNNSQPNSQRSSSIPINLKDLKTVPLNTLPVPAPPSPQPAQLSPHSSYHQSHSQPISSPPPSHQAQAANQRQPLVFDLNNDNQQRTPKAQTAAEN